MKTPTSATDRDAEAGFTLVEALCALAILSLAYVSLSQGMSGAAQNNTRLNELSTERMIARSLAAQVHARPRNSRISGAGNWGAFAWRISARPVSDSLAVHGASDKWRLYEITYDVVGPHSSSAFSSMRLAPAQ